MERNNRGSITLTDSVEPMRRQSNLNPNAEAYFPLKREADNVFESSTSRTAERVKKEPSDCLGRKSIKKRDEMDYETDLEYLRLMKPDYSIESIGEAYFSSQCDVESAIEMLEFLTPSVKDNLHILQKCSGIDSVPLAG